MDGKEDLKCYVQEVEMGPYTLQHIVDSKCSLGARKTRNNTPGTRTPQPIDPRPV